MTRLKSILVVAALSSCVSSAWAGTPPADLVTLLDYFEEGLAGTDRWIARRSEKTDGELPRRLRECRETCVRIAVEFEGADGQRRSVLGSGVIVDEGRRVLTAGHSLTGAPADATIRVTLRDGRSLQAVPAATPDPRSSGSRHDWALLDLVEPPEDLPSARTAKASRGDTVVVLGYPDRLGLDEEGRAVHGFSRERAALDPMPFVARVNAPSVMELEPVAGAVPVAGASGAPLFNEDGELVGVFVAVGRLAYPEGLRYLYEAAPVDAVDAPALPPLEPAVDRAAR